MSVNGVLQLNETIKPNQQLPLSEKPVGTIWDGNIQTSDSSSVEGIQNTSLLNNAIKSVRDAIPNIQLSNEQCIQLLLNYHGATKELLEKDSVLVDKAVNHIKETVALLPKYQKLGKIGKQVTFEDINKYTKNYTIQLDAGWESITSFEKAQDKKIDNRIDNRVSFNERLKKFGYKEDSSIEDKKKAMKAYIDEYFDKKIKAGGDPNKIAKLQLTDFSKLLFNSSEEERVEMVESIEYLLAENRCPAYKSILESMLDVAGKQKVADAATFEKRQTWDTIKDVTGKCMSAEDSLEIGIETSKYASEEAIDRDTEAANSKAKELYTPENIKRYEELKKKDPNLLTEEEQKFIREYEFQQTFRSSQMLGVPQNQNITNVEAKLQQLNDAAKEYASPVYNKIIEQVHEYIEKHPESLTLSKDDFDKLMADVIGEDYTKLPSSASSQSQTSAQDENGLFVTQPQTVVETANAKRIEQRKEIKANSDEEINPKITVTPIENHSKTTLNDALQSTSGFMRYINENGVGHLTKIYGKLDTWKQKLLVNVVANESDKQMADILNYKSTMKLRRDVSAKLGGFSEDMFKKLTSISGIEKVALGMLQAEKEEEQKEEEV